LQTAFVRQHEIVEDDTDLSPLSVLVVDDETAIREALKEYLQHLGVYRIQTAENGRCALEVMRHTHFDFVFMDLMMPEMGGMELLERLSRMGSPTSVVVMTGYPSMEKVISATRYGACDFLVKPFRLQDVGLSIQRIRRLHSLVRKNWMLEKELEAKSEVERLNIQLERKIKEKSLLYDIIESLSTINRSETLFEFIVKKASEACDAERACFLIYEQDLLSMLLLTQNGLNGVKPGAKAVLIPHPEERYALEDRFLNNCFGHFGGGPTFVDRVIRTEGLISVPVNIRRQPFGLLVVGRNKAKCPFSADDEFLVSFIAEKAALSVENMALYDHLKENLFATLGALVSAIEAKDLYTQQHSERVTQLAMKIARKLGCSQEELRRLEASGPLHDIGKIGIDDHILKKPDKLTDEEFERIKTHPMIGVNIVTPLGLDEEELAIIRNHHERWDGMGYPDGISGNRIPRLARILSVADAFDAMNSNRAYRNALPFESCMKELRRNSGTQFDPEVLDAALPIISGEPLH
jgi:putative nucleotidyltransferase with HDIG domain